jgi:hypothetical protein
MVEFQSGYFSEPASRLRKHADETQALGYFDRLLFVAAFLSLIFSEIIYFQGHKQDAIFVGLWVPSILGVGIYLKLIGNKKNE